MKVKDNKFLKGALVLTLASLIAKLIGAFYRVPLISLIGSNGLGVFQLIFPIYSFFLIFITGGISLGLSKLVSIEVKNNNFKNAKKLLFSCLSVMLIFSVFIALILLLICYPLSIFQGNSKFSILYLALLPALVFTSLISAFRGYYQGLENMLPSGISQILEQIVKLGAGLLLANFFIKKGVIFAVFGAFLGISLSELVALTYLICVYLIKYRKKQEQEIQENYNFKYCFKLIIKTCFPIMLNSVILPFVYAIESMICVWLLSKATISSSIATSLFGLEDGIVTSLVNLPTVIAVALSTALLPSLSSSFSSNNIVECEKKVSSAIKYTWLITLPCALGFMFLSKDIIKFLYSSGLSSNVINELNIASDLLKISSLNIIYISLLNIVTSSLQAISKSYIPVKNLIIASIIKIIATFVLVSNPAFNIYGLVISDVICFSLALILDFSALKKELNIAYDFKYFVFNPLFSASIMLGVIVLMQILFENLITNRLLTLIVISFGIVVYFAILFITKTLKFSEFKIFEKFRKKSS